ncbi:MAG: AAA family ATPase [Burkholderiales bacterium]
MYAAGGLENRDPLVGAQLEQVFVARDDALVAAKAPLTLDEVQRSPKLLLAVKRAVDRDRRPGRFLLSGSANLALPGKVSEPLAG